MAIYLPPLVLVSSLCCLFWIYFPLPAWKKNSQDLLSLTLFQISHHQKLRLQYQSISSNSIYIYTHTLPFFENKYRWWVAFCSNMTEQGCCKAYPLGNQRALLNMLYWLLFSALFIYLFIFFKETWHDLVFLQLQ